MITILFIIIICGLIETDKHLDRIENKLDRFDSDDNGVIDFNDFVKMCIWHDEQVRRL